MKVYLVSSGEYSSWEIEGIFSSLRKAKKCIERLRDASISNLQYYDYELNFCDYGNILEVKDA